MILLPKSSTELQHCLYFLVSKASTGPQAGLFKLGISSRLPDRHHKHTLRWEEFDLSRSALLRACTRREVQRLETALRHIFGDAGTAGGSRAVGQTHRPDGSPAPATWRCDPGRKADGHTEFYDVACLPTMLAFVEHWLFCRAERGAGARLQRGITPADAARGLGIDAGAPTLTKEDKATQRVQRRSQREQDLAALEAHIATRVSQVLDFALAHEEHLLHVHLNLWHRVRASGQHWHSSFEGLVDLYFGGFGAAPTGTDAESEHRSPAQIAFEERFEALLAAPAHSERLRGRYWEDRAQVACLREASGRSTDTFLDDTLLHLGGTDTLLVRVQPWLYEPVLPLFEQFDALARRVEGRRGYDQPDLGL